MFRLNQTTKPSLSAIQGIAATLTVLPTFDDLWARVGPDLGDEIHPYIHHFGFRGIIGQCLSSLETAQFGKNKEDWARNWALELAEGDPDAQLYSMYRKLCLRFLYKIIDKNLLSLFKPYRADRIVRTCLVMDRANTIFNRINRFTNTRGSHWYAEADNFWMESLLDRHEEIKFLRKSKAPLNRRLRALLENDELGYKDDAEIRRWMVPKSSLCIWMRVHE